MPTTALPGGRVTLTYDAALTVTQERETRAVPYALTSGIAPVTAVLWTAIGPPGTPAQVRVTLPAPVCGLGESVGLPFWFSRVRPRPLLTAAWEGSAEPDAPLAVQDGVLFSGAGVAVLPQGDGLLIELTTEGDVATYTLTSSGQVGVTILEGPDLGAVWSAYVRQVGWPTDVPALTDAAIVYCIGAAPPPRVTQAAVLELATDIQAQGFPNGIIALADDGQQAEGHLRFDPATFPDPPAMEQELRAQGFTALPTTAWSQQVPTTVRMADLAATWSLTNGLAALPVRLLTLALLGYPFVLPAPIGGVPGVGQRVTGELLVRWTQASAFTLGMQFSHRPWRFLAPVPGLCRAYTWLHLALKEWMLDYARRVTCQNGYPVVRPLALDYPTDSQALACTDQWLLGDRLLVAPVLGQPRGREVYLPAGHWYDPWSDGYVDGPKRLEIRVPLHLCPFFLLTEEDDDPWAAIPAVPEIVRQIKRLG